MAESSKRLNYARPLPWTCWPLQNSHQILIQTIQLLHGDDQTIIMIIKPIHFQLLAVAFELGSTTKHWQDRRYQPAGG